MAETLDPTSIPASAPSSAKERSQSSLRQSKDSEAKSAEDFWPKGSLKTTEIALGGTKVKVKTDSTPATLKQIRDLVDERFSQFADKLEKGVSTHQLTVLVAFNLAEELLKERERNRILKKKTVEWTERLLDRVESHLSRKS